MYKYSLLMLAFLTAGCTHSPETSAPGITPASQMQMGVDVVNSFSEPISVEYCDSRECGKLGVLAANARDRYQIPSAETRGVMIIGKFYDDAGGSRWVAQERVAFTFETIPVVTLAPK